MMAEDHEVVGGVIESKGSTAEEGVISQHHVGAMAKPFIVASKAAIKLFNDLDVSMAMKLLPL